MQDRVIVLWSVVWLTVALMVPGSIVRADEADAEPPNIVLIFADDLGYGDVGCYGATKLETPNIDRLAQQGRRFTDAHSASAVCTPSRYGLLTGQYPFRKNLWGPVFARHALTIPTEKTTIASMLDRQGYATACIGKWHLGFTDHRSPNWNKALKPGPLEVGFDYYFGIPVVNSHNPFVLVENHHVVGLDPDDPLKYGGTPPTKNFPEKMVNRIVTISGGKQAHAMYKDRQLGTDLTEKAVAWLKERDDEPFFLYFATPQIHHPFTPHPRFEGTSDAGRYGDWVHELDWMVGRIMKTLKEMDEADNTLVIFTSDNGGMLNAGGRKAWRLGHRLNGELLGFKFSAWEGGHRVPFIARWPGRIEPGTTSDQLLSQLDMMATFAAITDEPLKPDAGPDSFNMLPALTGSPDRPIRKELIVQPFRKKNLALRQGPWVYIGARGGGGFDDQRGGLKALKITNQENSDIVNGRYKRNAPKAQLYNLKKDLPQSVNVIRKHREVAKRLKARLKELKQKSRTAPTGR
jgi:arylsulfatase A-like enzyme